MQCARLTRRASASQSRDLRRIPRGRFAPCAANAGPRRRATSGAPRSLIAPLFSLEDSLGQFGIGQAVRRKEDVRFVTGAGRFTDDVNLPGQAYAYLLRSPHAHARIRGIATEEAKAAPGILAVYTHADLAADKLGAVQCAVPLKNY